jgi:2-(1,2-epoxy-1,2-dihydrophenyl)acetyl-CoA isomerase
MRRDLAEALEEAGSDRNVRVVVITGAGRAFCAGGDVAFMAELMQRATAKSFRVLLGAARRVILAIRQMTKPVIARSMDQHRARVAISRSRATCASLQPTRRSASRSRKSGFHPDWGGTISAATGDARTKRAKCFFSAIRSTRVVAPEELEAETRKLAERLRDGAAVSIAAAKHAVYASEHDNLDRMLQYEVEAQIRCFESEDGREGVRAFLEKRPPTFTGR